MITEDEALEQAWLLHPELEGVDLDREEQETGVNWHLHLTLDAIVLRRMSDATLPDAAVIEELERRGKSHQEAIHEVARVLLEVIRGLLTQAREQSGRARGGQTTIDSLAWNDILTARIRELV